MLKRKALRKIFITTFVLFVLLTIYFIPTKGLKESNNVVYKYSNTTLVSVYLLNDSSQLTKVNIKVSDASLEETIKSIIKKLTISNDATIPMGLEQVIPKNVKLLDIFIEEGIVHLNFSKEFLDIPNDKIESVIESVSYSILSLNNITGVSIYAEEENISKLFPKNIPNIITKEYGINRRIELKNFMDISKIVIYYLDTINDQNYYVPITKYVNDKRDKIKIIIDELSSNYIFEPNLISLLDRNIELMDYEINNDIMILNFNNSIFMERDNILEEVVYSISYSVFANYDVEEVIFKVNNEEIAKKSLKDIE